MSNRDREKWDTKYGSGSRIAPKPPKALVDNVHQLRPGKLLDVASGEGAVSLYVSALDGYQVTAIDISSNGLLNLDYFAQQNNLLVNSLCVDLDNLSCLNNIGLFDNVCLFRFKPTVALFNKLVSMLAVNGRLIISTFNERHHLEMGFNEKFCLSKGELLNINDALQLIDLQQSIIAPYTDTYVFEKK